MKLSTLLSLSSVAKAGLTSDAKTKKENRNLSERLGTSIPEFETVQDDCAIELSPVVELFSSISNRLAPQILGNLFLENAENSEVNLISSPFTLATQFALLFEASDGETQEELKKLTLMTQNGGGLEALKELKQRFQCLTKASFEVENVFFMDSSFIPKADYFKKLKSVGANLFQVPFAEQPEMSRIMIDSWLEYGKELIEGGLPAALPKNSVSSETSLMMLSQSEFNAKWAVKFENEYPGGFLLPNGKTKMVTMMEATYPMQHIISCTDYPQYFDCNSNSAIPTLVEIPLESSSLQVIAIKPNKNLPKEAIVALSPDYFHQLWLPAADQNLRTVKLIMPQLDIESQYEMSNALFGLGVEQAFQPFKANFTPLTDSPGISLSNVYQQSFLKWDVEGAAAGIRKAMTIKLGTFGRNANLSPEIHDHEIIIDQSFVVFITDRKTRTNLFLGVVNDPR